MPLGRRLPGAAPAALLLAGCVASVPPEPALQEIDPETLVGLGPDALTAQLGQPELLREERPVEVWQYRSDRCVLDLYLDEAGGAGPQVVYYEARHRGEGEVQPARCLGEIVAQDQTPAG